MNVKLIGRNRNSAETILAVTRESQNFASEDSLKKLNGLGVPLKKGKSYLVRGRVMVLVNGGGLRIGFDVGSEVNVLTFEVRKLAADGGAPLNASVSVTGEAVSGAIAAGDYVVEVNGYIQNADANSTFQLTGSQNTQTDPGVTFIAGSYLEFTEL